MEMQNGAFWLHGKPFFLYSGEVHYFRIPKKDWAARLRALRAAGFNTVSTYIPWIWHAPEEGKFDFTGETVPERDVLGFLDLAKKEKLSVLARVGPVSNAELRHEGLPAWLVENYPDVFVTGRRDVGNLPHVTIISYLHPEFQRHVGDWYAALLPSIADRQTTRGGNVLGVQLCNEVAMVHWLQKGSDHKDHVNRFYRAFLKDTYGTVAALNAAHGSAWASFDDVAQPKGEEASAERARVTMDWALFYRRYYATYFATLSRRALERGIDVPLFCNIPQFYDYDIRGRGNWAPMTTSMFRDFPLLTPNLVFGGAYQMRHLDFENFHDVALTTEVTRMIGAVDVPSAPPVGDPVRAGRLPKAPAFTPLVESPVPVVCAELQTGIMRDRPRLYPTQVELNVKSSVGQGLAGVNGYMLAGGENPPGLGAFGTYHDWQAPIGPQGEIRAHMEPLRRFGRFIKWAGPHLALTQKVADTTLGFYTPYYATEYLSGPWSEGLEARRTALWYDGLARLIQLAGYSYRMMDIERSPVDVLLASPSLWIYTEDFMDHDTQAKLAGYVKNGGRLLIGPRLPTRDMSGGADTTLADALGVAVAEERKGGVFTDEGTEWWVGAPVQVYKVDAPARVWRNTPTGPAAVEVEAGRGRAIVVGFGVPHVFDHFRDWVRRWGEALGARPTVTVDPGDLQAVLRRSDDLGFLFVFNYHFTEQRGRVTTPFPGTDKPLRLPAQGRMILPPLSARVLPLNVPLDDRRRLAWSTAEVLDAAVSPRGFKGVVAATPGERVSLALALPKKPRAARAGGARAALTWRGGRAEVVFSADAPETGVNIDF
jgi:beta-galactosidase